MVLRLLVGLIKGMVLGGLAGFGLASLGFAVPAAWVAYPAAVVMGLLIAGLAGKPIWAKGARIEVGMKAVVAAIFAPLLLLAARTWVSTGLPVDPALVGLESVTASVGMFAVTSYAMVGAVLAGFFDADNDPGEAAAESPKAETQPRKRIAAEDGAEAEAMAEAEAADENGRQRHRT